MRNCLLKIKQCLKKINILNIFNKVTFDKALQLFKLNQNNYKFSNAHIIKIREYYFLILQIKNFVNSKYIIQTSNNKAKNRILTNLQFIILIIIIKQYN